MRARVRLGLLAGLAAAALACAARASEVWQDYSYPEQRFGIHFPAEPTVAPGRYPAVTASGARVDVPATVYAVRRGETQYRVTVADLAGSAAEDRKALDHAVAALRAEGNVGLDAPVSMGNSSCGRYLGIERAGGVLNYIALFYNRETRLLYDVQAHVPPADQAEHGADAVHFQQSLSFLADPEAPPPPPVDYPESWRPHVYDVGFSIRFPAAPAVTQASYRTEAGIVVPATLYSVREGDTLYRVTAAHIWQTEADTDDAVDQAARLWFSQGTPLAEETISIMSGQCGRDTALRRPDGGLSTAKIFFPSSQHRLYLVEVVRDAAGGDAPREADRWFRDSFALARPEE